MSDKRLTLPEALRVAIESLRERASDANNAIIDCDRTVRMLEGALQRHEDQPCQKTNANAGTGAKDADSKEGFETGHPTSLSTAAVDSTTTRGTPSAPPSEPEAVTIATGLRWIGHTDECYSHENGPDTCDCGSDEANKRAVASLAALSARLKMAEELLTPAASVWMSDHDRSRIRAFLAGKGEA